MPVVHRTLRGAYYPCHCPPVHDSFATTRFHLGSTLSMLPGWKYNFHYSIHIYMQLDRVGTLHSAVLMDLSRDSAEAATYMMSRLGYGTLAGQPRVACLSVAETEKIRKRCRGEAARGAWKTRRACKRAAAEAQVADDI